MDINNIKETNRRQNYDGFTWLFLLVLALSTATLSGYFFLSTKDASNWPTTQGVVKNSWLEQIGTRGSNLTHFEIGVEYTYIVNGQNYHKNNKTDITGSIPGYTKGEALKLLSMFPKGKKISVYYNPTKPEVSVLIPTILYILLCTSIISSLLSLGLIYLGFRFREALWRR